MTVYVIYKQTTDKHGNIIKAEIVECDTNEVNANRFSKLYNLQVATDLKPKIQFGYLATKVS
jgi:hypothetical protein